MKPRDRECSTCREYETKEGYCRLKDRYRRPTDGENCTDHRLRPPKRKTKQGQREEHENEIVTEVPLISSTRKVFF